MTRHARPLLTALALAAAGVLIGQGTWLQVKAVLAQALIHHAWAAAQRDGTVRRPWPWADHWPVARLRVPAHGQDLIVLEGDSGAVLAFAPGHNPQSGLPGSGRTIVISGHRDTHFRFLAALQPGQAIQLDGPQASQRFRVTGKRIVDSRRQGLAIGEEVALVLVTCYPFDAIAAGGPLRYVVEAQPWPRAAEPIADTRKPTILGRPRAHAR